MEVPVYCLPAGETEIRPLSAEETKAFRHWLATNEAPEPLQRFFETGLFCESVADEDLTPAERERIEAIARRGPRSVPHEVFMRELEERRRRGV